MTLGGSFLSFVILAQGEIWVSMGWVDMAGEMPLAFFFFSFLFLSFLAAWLAYETISLSASLLCLTRISIGLSGLRVGPRLTRCIDIWFPVQSY